MPAEHNHKIPKKGRASKPAGECPRCDELRVEVHAALDRAAKKRALPHD